MQRTLPLHCNMCDSPSRMVCSRCCVAVYCSPACQRHDWQRGHRETCHLVRQALVEYLMETVRAVDLSKPMVGMPADKEDWLGDWRRLQEPLRSTSSIDFIQKLPEENRSNFQQVVLELSKDDTIRQNVFQALGIRDSIGKLLAKKMKMDEKYHIPDDIFWNIMQMAFAKRTAATFTSHDSNANTVHVFNVLDPGPVILQKNHFDHSSALTRTDSKKIMLRPNLWWCHSRGERSIMLRVHDNNYKEAEVIPMPYLGTMPFTWMTYWKGYVAFHANLSGFSLEQRTELEINTPRLDESGPNAILVIVDTENPGAAPYKLLRGADISLYALDDVGFYVRDALGGRFITRTGADWEITTRWNAPAELCATLFTVYSEGSMLLYKLQPPVEIAVVHFAPGGQNPVIKKYTLDLPHQLNQHSKIHVRSGLVFVETLDTAPSEGRYNLRRASTAVAVKLIYVAAPQCPTDDTPEALKMQLICPTHELPIAGESNWFENAIQVTGSTVCKGVRTSARGAVIVWISRSPLDSHITLAYTTSTQLRSSSSVTMSKEDATFVMGINASNHLAMLLTFQTASIAVVDVRSGKIVNAHTSTRHVFGHNMFSLRPVLSDLGSSTFIDVAVPPNLLFPQ